MKDFDKDDQNQTKDKAITKPTAKYPSLLKPLTHPWNHCPVVWTSPRTTTPWT